MPKSIDNFLDSTTMYSLLWRSLMILAGFAILFGFLGVIAYGGVSLIGSAIILSLVCYGSNYIFARIVSASVNFESSFITALILFFILKPAVSMYDYGILIVAGIIAMASKYVLAIRMKHVFNPAALSVFILGLFGVGSAMWWMATPALLPIVAIIGFLILRKIDKFKLFFIFAFVAIITILAVALSQGASLLGTLPLIFTSWPLIFFGSIMLTEPLSTPPKATGQTIYAVLVGLLFGAQFHFGPVFSTPECALIIGNIYSFIISPKFFSKLTLREKNQLSPSIYEFVFSSAKRLVNVSGQYLEWTLPHKNMDSRGTRRYFTVTSSPTEDGVKIAVRVNAEKGSSFKKALVALKTGDTLFASGLSGDFVLPKDTKKKLVFIAGGIGITPFRSMAQCLIDRADRRDIILLYSNKTPADIVYKDIFEKAQRIGLKTLYVIDDANADISALPGALRKINAETITSNIPDYKERIFYLSGPPGMVSAYEELLKTMGIKKSNIVTDFFPGY